MKFSAAIAAPAPVYEAQQQLQQLTTGSRSEDIKSAAAWQAARAQVALAQTQVDDTIIRAPFAGIVTQKYATVGRSSRPLRLLRARRLQLRRRIVALASELEIK